MALVPIGGTTYPDSRGRFRSVFCNLPSIGSDRCARLLRQFPDEPAFHDQEIRGAVRVPTEIVIVEGLLGECIPEARAFSDAVGRLEDLGYRVSYAPTFGRAGSEVNAGVLYRYVQGRKSISPGTRIVLIAYSKGAVDALTALATFADLSRSVAAVVSIAGPVNGSPLAESLHGIYRLTLGWGPSANCAIHDRREIDSLRRDRRLAFLAAMPLPGTTRYYSIAAVPEPSKVSRILRGLHAALARHDPRNDGQVVYYDALFPTGTLLAYVNADHFGVAMPFDRAPGLLKFLIDKTAFPRAELLEATMRIVEQDLDHSPHE